MKHENEKGYILCKKCSTYRKFDMFDFDMRTGCLYKVCNKCRIKSVDYRRNHPYDKEKAREQYISYRRRNYENIREREKEYQRTHKELFREKDFKYKISLALYKTYFKYFHKNEEIREDENGYLLVRCKYCNKWFVPTNGAVKHYIYRYDGRSNLYCSDACKISCPIFGRVTKERGIETNTSREVQPELRKMVLERDNWTCQKCGLSKLYNNNIILHCHHIEPVKINPIESADVDNCITLCEDCHKEVHRTIGCRYTDLAKCETIK